MPALMITCSTLTLCTASILVDPETGRTELTYRRE
jgi:hypothetical protein